MEPVSEIFEAFGNSPTKLARATGLKVQTVCDWRRKGNPHIPLWRRSTVLIAIEKVGAEISPATLAYLMPAEQAAA